MTQQNAALVEEAAAAAESMQDQVQTLTKVVSVFKLGNADISVRPESDAVVHAKRNAAIRPRADAVTRSKGNGHMKRPAQSTALTPKPAKVANSDADWQEF